MPLKASTLRKYTSIIGRNQLSATLIHPIRSSRAAFGSIPDFYMGDNIVNFYAGQPPLNRLSFLRASHEKINKLLYAQDTKFVAFKDLKPLVKQGETSQLLLLDGHQVSDRIGQGFAGLTPEEEKTLDKDVKRFSETYRKPPACALVFLGIDDRAGLSSHPGSEDPSTLLQSKSTEVDLSNPPGTAYFAIDAGADDWVVEGGEWGDARSSASNMSAWEAGVFAQARALIDWNVRNKFCPMCGSQTYSMWAGWKRGCITGLGPVPGREPCPSLQGLHNFAYPRTDPVTIMGILNPAGDKILLGRQSRWPKGMYSCLAGFIEPGESFEDAVRREVLEEAGIEVGPVSSSSQPWPYPANVMVGCFGRARDGQKIRLDLDNELEDAQWFDRPTILALTSSPTGSRYTKAEMEKLGKLVDSGSNLNAKPTPSDDQQTASALAPSEGKVVENGNTDEGEIKGLTRIPPESAIAGKLIRLWAEGGLDLVSKL